MALPLRHIVQSSLFDQHENREQNSLAEERVKPSKRRRNAAASQESAMLVRQYRCTGGRCSRPASVSGLLPVCKSGAGSSADRFEKRYVGSLTFCQRVSWSMFQLCFRRIVDKRRIAAVCSSSPSSRQSRNNASSSAPWAAPSATGSAPNISQAGVTPTAFATRRALFHRMPCSPVTQACTVGCETSSLRARSAALRPLSFSMRRKRVAGVDRAMNSLIILGRTYCNWGLPSARHFLCPNS